MAPQDRIRHMSRDRRDATRSSAAKSLSQTRRAQRRVKGGVR